MEMNQNRMRRGCEMDQNILGMLLFLNMLCADMLAMADTTKRIEIPDLYFYLHQYQR